MHKIEHKLNNNNNKLDIECFSKIRNQWYTTVTCNKVGFSQNSIMIHES